MAEPVCAQGSLPTGKDAEHGTYESRGQPDGPRATARFGKLNRKSEAEARNRRTFLVTASLRSPRRKTEVTMHKITGQNQAAMESESKRCGKSAGTQRLCIKRQANGRGDTKVAMSREERRTEAIAMGRNKAATGMNTISQD
ncbi:predicted protein [Chaetomium globosum CBS 148.51]|uniref:Uncharacterized protein n=1 Tax=Chaetomium globosum (strain ATCC 6205 / CBS 148.51 / DSM 1962 / NBRC 6347 / NRRL 1970) TaxID=306901 RepID=Q2HAM4_CHAGB|nr:uncharacterized protein CHGG_02730 [Chaetomium globosum CBS 148.51]EAQ90795.1 predicted protein [Chaetomium globosum CBS 148.51]